MSFRFWVKDENMVLGSVGQFGSFEFWVLSFELGDGVVGVLGSWAVLSVGFWVLG